MTTDYPKICNTAGEMEDVRHPSSEILVMYDKDGRCTRDKDKTVALEIITTNANGYEQSRMKFSVIMEAPPLAGSYQKRCS